LAQTNQSPKVKAVILLSGGLDSTLAAYLMQKQSIDLIALNFISPFCLCNKKGGCAHGAREISKNLNLEFVTIDNSDEMLEAVKKPKYGYGSNMNPCLDCRIIMLKKTKEFMSEIGASFVITGEVLEQRPMSQKRHLLRLVEKESGLEGLILRPLSAKMLDETIPEKQGLVDRAQMLDICGRSRKGQIELVKEFGINDYPCPAGGCLLTDPNFCRRLKDLMKYNAQFTLNDVLLLKLGRHFRLNPELKLIVGRNELENSSLLNLVKSGDSVFRPKEEIAGPTAIARGKMVCQDRQMAVNIVSRYCDKLENEPTQIIVEDSQNNTGITLESPRVEEGLIEKLKI
jgi:tRNA U34 2-thiouridine synthase MnmA/TrmU